MARRKNKKTGCLFGVLIFLVLPLIVYLIQKPKGPEVPYDASVSDNHLVYFDAVTVSLTESRTQKYTSRTRRTVRTGFSTAIEYVCTTSDGQTVRLVVEKDSNASSKKNFSSEDARGKRIHGVKVGDGSNAYVRFESYSPIG